MFKGNKLKEARTKNGLTLKELAEKSGVPFTTINGWEINSNAKPRKSLLLRVCDVLKIQISSLYEEDNSDDAFELELEDVVKLIDRIIQTYKRDPKDPRIVESLKLFKK